MKSLITFLVLFSFSNAFARDFDCIERSGLLRVAVDGQTPGFNYYQGKELTGFEVELTNEIAKRMGLTVEWVVQPFNTLLPGLSQEDEQERFDLIATSHAITPEREKSVDFAEPLYCSEAMIVAKTGGPKTQSDLKNKVVAVPTGTVYQDFMKKIPAIKKIKPFESETDALKDLLAGKSDAWITEQFVALDAAKVHKELQLGATLFSEKNAMVVAKGNRKLLVRVNQQLRSILGDGTYARLSQKYFQKDIRCN